MHILTRRLVRFERFLQVASLFYCGQDTCKKIELQKSVSRIEFKVMSACLLILSLSEPAKNMRKMYHYFFILSTLFAVGKPLLNDSRESVAQTPR